MAGWLNIFVWQNSSIIRFFGCYNSDVKEVLQSVPNYDVYEQFLEEEATVGGDVIPDADKQLNETDEENDDEEQVTEIDLLSFYFKDIRRFPRLPVEEQDRLLQIIRHGNDVAAAKAEKKLVLSNTGLVVFIANKYKGRGLPFEDLIQEGNVSLLKAINTYESRHDATFSTFAYVCIRQDIMNALQDKVRSIRLPSRPTTLLNRIRRYTEFFLQQEHRYPRLEELAKTFKVDKVKLLFLIRASMRPANLEQTLSPNSKTMISDVFPDAHQMDPERSMIESQKMPIAEQIKVLLGLLTEKQAQVLILLFGLEEGTEPMTLAAIAEQRGTSINNIFLIKEAALTRLRSPNVRAFLVE
jgi:RNA polymerase primary sigma factor